MQVCRMEHTVAHKDARGQVLHLDELGKRSVVLVTVNELDGAAAVGRLDSQAIGEGRLADTALDVDSRL
jgi:hypothetical protein